MDPKRLMRRINSGSVANVDFRDLQRLVESCGFRLARVRGSHHIYEHPEFVEKLNLQQVGGQAKPYQIWQFLALAERYDLKPRE